MDVPEPQTALDAAAAPPGPPVAHEDVRRYLARSETSSTWRDGDLEALRRETRAAALAVRGELEPSVAVESRVIGGMSCRLYRPAAPARDPHNGGVVLWAHGGGWVHGDLDSYEGVARAMAAAAACPVLAVDYRLAPEHPYPAALDDVWAAVLWARDRFDRVVLAGDSSGGNLAAAAAIKARDQGVPLALQVLVYPVLDSAAGTAYKLGFRQRYATFAGQAGFGEATFDRIARIWQQYVPDPAERTDPYASPSHADSLRGLAPTVVVTAEHDFLRGEAEDYVRRLRADHVPVTLQEFPGQIHGFFQMRGALQDAHRAMDLVAKAIRDALSQPPR